MILFIKKIASLIWHRLSASSIHHPASCLLLPASCILYLASCTTINLYERNAAIPGHQWQSTYNPEFTFTINDTIGVYNVLLTLRHNEKYNYNNIWMVISIQAPADTARNIRIEKILATNKEGWLATAMDDIYEHRISVNEELGNNNFSFRKTGDYTFTLKHIMREDPLQNIMNVGIRVEKKQ